MKSAVMSAADHARTLAVSACPGCAGRPVACSARRVDFYASAMRFFAYCFFYYFYFIGSAHQPKGTQAATQAAAE